MKYPVSVSQQHLWYAAHACVTGFVPEILSLARLSSRHRNAHVAFVFMVICYVPDRGDLSWYELTL